MKVIIGGKCTDSIIEAVDAYANKRVEDALEVAADTAQELTKAIVESYDRALDEANEHIAKLEADVEYWKGRVGDLENMEVWYDAELTYSRGTLNEVEDILRDDKKEPHKLVREIQEALAKSYIERVGLGTGDFNF